MPALVCPICLEALELEDAYIPSNVAAAPAIAEAMGLGSGQALLAIHAGQALKRNEANLDRHFRTHPPTDWLPVIMSALKVIGDDELTMLSAIAISDGTTDAFDREVAGPAMARHLRSRIADGSRNINRPAATR